MEPYDRNTPYNALPLLPPDSNGFLTDKVLSSLTMASRLLSELKGMASMLPNQSMFLNTISLREAKTSTAIENIFTTDDELYEALSWKDEFVKDGPAKEIIHYREAIWKGYAELKRDGIITTQIIIDIYRIIKQVTDGIRPYQAEVVIKKRGSDELGGTVIYTPPRGKGIIESKLANLLEFINDDEKYQMDPLLKMAMAHYQFEAIHPFRDGNGRTGRILSLLVLIQKGLIDMPILYLSAYIINTKNEYYRLISTVTASQRWEEWIQYMLENIKQTSAYTLSKIKAINNLMEKTESAVLDKIPKFKKDVLAKIFEQPYIRPKNLLGESIKSVNTAKKYLTQLETLGFLSKVRIGNEYVFINASLMEVLSD